MNIYSISSLFAFIFCLTLGAFIFIRRYRDIKCRSFGIAIFVTGLWTSFPFLASRIDDPALMLFVTRLVYIPAIFTPVVWIRFAAAVKQKLSSKDKKILILGYCFSAVFLLFSFSPFFIRGVNRFAPHFSVVPGPLYLLFVVGFTVSFSFILWSIFSEFKNASGYYRNQLKIIFFSFVLGVISGLLHFCAAYFNKEPFPHDLLLILYVSLIAYAIIKYRLMDITVTITRTGVFVAVYALVLGLPFLLATLGRSQLVEFLGAAWWIGPMLLMVGLGICGPFVYVYLEKRALAILFREQRRYQEILKAASVDMTRIRNLPELLDFITHTITDSVRITHSAIYLWDAKTEQFIFKTGINLKKDQPASIDKKSTLMTWFESKKESLVYEEIKSKSEASLNPIFKNLREEMFNLNAAIAVPGFLDGKLLDVIILGDKLSGRMYGSEDLNNFSVLAGDSALAIENALLYGNIEREVQQRTKELMDVQKQLVQAEKLATVGTLAGGVAHEINNPLTAVLTNVQMMLMDCEDNDNPDKESLELIEEATKRCRKIVQKLMVYSRKPMETSSIADVDLKKSLQGVITFLSYQLEQEDIKIIPEIKNGTYTVKGTQNEFEQVITNLILNAKDAIKKIKKGGNVRITLSKNKDWIKLEVEDEGAGIPDEIVLKIFDPFFTTKDVGKGLGLGLSICQAIVEKHKGTISARCVADSGSVFTVKLPTVEVPVVSKN